MSSWPMSTFPSRQRRERPDFDEDVSRKRSRTLPALAKCFSRVLIFDFSKSGMRKQSVENGGV